MENILEKEKVVNKRKHFNTPIIYGQQFENIDAEKGIIKGVHVCCEGEARGHQIMLDKEFIRDVTKFGNEQPMGVKSRFGHPNMSSTTLGSFVGRFHNYRNSYIERDSGDKALASVADLYLDEASKISPNGDLFNYTLELAENSPDMFGSSIVFIQGPSKFKKEKTGAKDEKGKDVYKDIEYATIKSLLATDLVDDGAATDRLYSSDSFAEQVTHYLDNNPEIYDILLNEPEIVENFISNYKAYKSNAEKLSLIKNQTIMSKENDENKGIEVNDEKSFLDKVIAAVTPKAEIKDISEETKSDYDNQIAEIQKKLDIANADVERLTSELGDANTSLDLAVKAQETLTNENKTLKAENESFTKENDNLSAENTKHIAGDLEVEKEQDKSKIGEISDYDKGLQADAKKLEKTASGK